LDRLFKQLDLSEYLATFNAFLAREKPLFLQGDSRVNYEKIAEICEVQLEAPKPVANLDEQLLKISKQATLHISEIYEFAKIISYFCYLKKLNFQKRMQEYLAKIVIPDEILEISRYFKDDGTFKDEIDERFGALNSAFAMKKAQISDELRRLISARNLSEYLVDFQIHYINENEALLVRGGFNRALKGNVIARSSGGYFYVIPAAIERLKSEQSDLLGRKEELIYEYCQKISAVFYRNLAFLKFINSAFDQTDALIARALFAKSRDLNFILSDKSRDVILEEFAHPALKNPKRISVNFQKKVLLITGVNAGGKSMLLKSIMSACLLAKYLLPFSVKSAKIGTFKEFDAIIEDPQSVKNDISTFAGRMLNFSRLFHKKQVLIGIDEIELGTDFEEAASLYGVLISKLIENDAKIVITTHHKRLAMILAKNEQVELAAALYDEENSRPKYEFLPGIIGKSYAFETALRYGIGANLVALAKADYGENKENLNIAITKAINLEQELKTRLNSAELKEKKLDALLESLKNEKERADEILKAQISRLENEYYQAINEAKKTIKLTDTKEKQRSINRANELKQKIQNPEFQAEIPAFKVGDRVKYDKIKGEIVALKKGEAIILSDGIRLRVPLNSLKRSGNPTPNAQKSVNVKVQRPNSGSVVLDLHGMRADEAIEKLDKFISDALICGFDEVLVKHGIGTGKLAFAVKEFLKSHPFVKEFSDGAPNLGGFGTKVVKL